MRKHPPYSVVLSYAHERQMLTVHAVEPAKLTAAVAGKIEVPICFDDFDFKLDDEFARRLGVAMLNVIALGAPEINQYISVTKDPAKHPADDE